MDLAWQLTGALLIVLALADIFLTVLYPRDQAGFIMPRINRRVWLAARWLGLRFGSRGRQLMSFCGPLLVVLSVAFWAVLLAVGFALIYMPALGTDIQASNSPIEPRFWSAFYFSAYALTTLGVGDLYAVTPAYRVLCVVEAALGFTVLTMTLTYLMSIYSALVEQNTFASYIHTLSGCTADSSVLLRRLVNDDAVADAQSSLARDLLGILEAHHHYPVIKYFTYPQPHYSLARVLLLCLDLVSISRSCPKEVAGQRLRFEMETLWDSARELAANLYGPVASKRHDCATPETDSEPFRELWRERHRHAIRELRQHFEGEDGGWDEADVERYVRLREDWFPDLCRSCAFLGRTWQQIDPVSAQLLREQKDRIQNRGSGAKGDTPSE